MKTVVRKRSWVAAWGVLAVAATFVEAIARLTARAAVELSAGMSLAHWAALCVLTCVMAYVEGYRALQRRFAPSVVTRAHEAAESGRVLWMALAPLYAVMLVGAARSAIARTAAGIAMIIVCVVLVRHLPAPWRGIVDAAVGVALTWGLVALIAAYHASSRSVSLAEEAVS